MRVERGPRQGLLTLWISLRDSVSLWAGLCQLSGYAAPDTAGNERKPTGLAVEHR